jgi:hypothetical protein
MGEIYNFETSFEDAKEIKKNKEIPPEIMATRMDYCAKQEGLRDGLKSSEEEIKSVLDKVGFKIEDRNLPVSIQLHAYLNEKYNDYIWRGAELGDDETK